MKRPMAVGYCVLLAIGVLALVYYLAAALSDPPRLPVPRSWLLGSAAAFVVFFGFVFWFAGPHRERAIVRDSSKRIREVDPVLRELAIRMEGDFREGSPILGATPSGVGLPTFGSASIPCGGGLSVTVTESNGWGPDTERRDLVPEVSVRLPSGAHWSLPPIGMNVFASPEADVDSERAFAATFRGVSADDVPSALRRALVTLATKSIAVDLRPADLSIVLRRPRVGTSRSAYIHDPDDLEALVREICALAAMLVAR
jgi:hypothetical protein